MSAPAQSQPSVIDFRTDPSRYRHWRLSVNGRIATAMMDVAEHGGLRPDYRLKLNSYDLGVDIELADLLQRIRFEHPQVAAVIIASAKPRVFSAGANIYMLGSSSHAFKVNFCKFTNETRNGIEDSSRYSGLTFIAACNGTTAGGGYELALACDEIVLVDDRTSAVSLPEVSLLAVLPGTGGLTRLIDKRRVRRDHADVFCTTPDGIKGERAKAWGLVDAVVRTQDFQKYVQERAHALAGGSTRPSAANGVELTPISRTDDEHGLHYQYVDVQWDRSARTATITARAPDVQPDEAETIERALAAGARWWPLHIARELDDAILYLRTNELEIGLWIFRTTGAPERVLAIDTFLASNQDHWFVREVIGTLRRTLARLEVSSRSLFALITPGSCFCGTLLELALASDRIYMLDTGADAQRAATLTVSPMNLGPLPTAGDRTRLESRDAEGRSVAAVSARVGAPLTAQEALACGLVTEAPDELDWDDEIRQAIESRVSLSADALTGMEANLRFGPHETLASRIFGRLSAWQNWIFVRPNAVGPEGALKVYGTGAPPKFERERI